MQDCAAQVVEGIRILAHILQPRDVLIGIEDNKPQAISMLRAVLAEATTSAFALSRPNILLAGLSSSPRS